MFPPAIALLARVWLPVSDASSEIADGSAAAPLLAGLRSRGEQYVH